MSEDHFAVLRDQAHALYDAIESKDKSALLEILSCCSSVAQYQYQSATLELMMAENKTDFAYAAAKTIALVCVYASLKLAENGVQEAITAEGKKSP